MDNNEKSRHSVWLSDEVWQEVDAFYKLDNCPTRNEFVEKALRQYCGRLHAERSAAYLPRALQEMLEGTLGVSPQQPQHHAVYHAGGGAEYDHRPGDQEHFGGHAGDQALCLCQDRTHNFFAFLEFYDSLQR